MTIALTRKIVWQETYRGIYPDNKLDNYDPEEYARGDLEKLCDPRHHYRLFMDEGSCVGFFSFGPYNYGSYKDFALCINHLYIRREYKRMGLGRRAFLHIREYCRREGIGKFFCGCNMHNTPAMDFYRHMGGIPGDIPSRHTDASYDIVHFEFYLGEEI